MVTYRIVIYSLDGIPLGVYFCNRATTANTNAIKAKLLGYKIKFDTVSEQQATRWWPSVWGKKRKMYKPPWSNGHEKKAY